MRDEAVVRSEECFGVTNFVRGRPRDEIFRMCADPRMIRSDVIRNVIEQQA